MSILIARFASGEEFLERFQDTFANGGLFYPTRKALEVGTSVVLDIRMALLKDAVLIRGHVAWRQRGKRGTPQRAGLGIEFENNETGKRDHLLALARGDRQPEEAQRKHRRLPVAIEIGWRVPSETQRHQSSLDDIGAGGLFIRTDQRPAHGTPLVLELSAPMGGSQSIEGRVAWTRNTGIPGVGVEFRCRDIGGMRRLRELIRRIESSTEAVASA